MQKERWILKTHDTDNRHCEIGWCYHTDCISKVLLCRTHKCHAGIIEQTQGIKKWQLRYELASSHGMKIDKAMQYADGLVELDEI